jgi:tetratricopeptide (TPR) repeat protein
VSSVGETAVNFILESVIAGRYADGVALHAQLKPPTPADDLWAGICHVALQQPLEANECLIRARNAGLEDAGAALVMAYRFANESSIAREALEGLALDRLTGFGRALAARERGVLLHREGRLRDAIVELERAWVLANNDPIVQRMIASWAGSLAYVLIESGRYAKAIIYLDRALEVHVGQRIHLLFTRGLCFASTGFFDRAEADLNEAQVQAIGLPAFEAIIRHFKGLLARTRGQLGAGMTEQLEVASLARTGGNLEQEFEAELELSAMAFENDDLDAAQAHLSRARNVADGVKHHALLAVRHGAILARSGSDAVVLEEAIKSICLAIAGLEELDLEAELGIANLHLAEAQVRAHKPDEARASLMRVVQARHYLGNGTVLARELRSLHGVFEWLTIEAAPNAIREGRPITPKPRATSRGLLVLLDDWQTLVGTSGAQIALTTLGRYDLTYNGEAVHLNTGKARTVETLAYLLENGETPLEQLGRNVFTDSDERRGRQYIHLIRKQLGKHLPGLSVPFDPDTGTYRVALADGVRLHYDALEVRRAVAVGGEVGLRHALGLYSGPFLPRSTDEWAEIVRRDLEYTISTLGRGALEDLFKLGRFEACVDLAHKLLEVNRLDVSIWVLLIQATMEWQGMLAGRQALELAARTFTAEVGEVPPPIADLQRRQGANLN